MLYRERRLLIVMNAVLSTLLICIVRCAWCVIVPLNQYDYDDDDDEQEHWRASLCNKYSEKSLIN